MLLLFVELKEKKEIFLKNKIQNNCYIYYVMNKLKYWKKIKN